MLAGADFGQIPSRSLSSSLYRISRMGGVPGAMGGGTFLHGRNQKFRIFSNSKIFKICEKINEKFIIFWKILKEIKKPSGKFLRVWAKNQWGLKFVEKILKFTYKTHNGKLIFNPFSLQSSRPFVILYTSGTSKNGRGSSGSGIGGYFRVGGGLYKFLDSTLVGTGILQFYVYHIKIHAPLLFLTQLFLTYEYLLFM